MWSDHVYSCNDIASVSLYAKLLTSNIDAKVCVCVVWGGVGGYLMAMQAKGAQVAPIQGKKVSVEGRRHAAVTYPQLKATNLISEC